MNLMFLSLFCSKKLNILSNYHINFQKFQLAFSHPLAIRIKIDDLLLILFINPTLL